MATSQEHSRAKNQQLWQHLKSTPLKQPAFATCQEPIGPKYQHAFAASSNPTVCPQLNRSWSNKSINRQNNDIDKLCQTTPAGSLLTSSSRSFYNLRKSANIKYTVHTCRRVICIHRRSKIACVHRTFEFHLVLNSTGHFGSTSYSYDMKASKVTGNESSCPKVNGSSGQSIAS
jgi:hypothetical protein